MWNSEQSGILLGHREMLGAWGVVAENARENLGKENAKESKTGCLYRAAKLNSEQYFPLLPMEKYVKGR